MQILRRVWNEKQSAIVQIVGLALAITVCLFIFSYAVYEYSFDSFHENEELIYRSHNTEPMLVGSMAKDNIGYVTDYARLHPAYRGLSIIISEDKFFYESRIYYADASFFDIFSFPILYGNAQEALNTNNQLIISESNAQKYFGEPNPVGKTLTVNGAYEHNITYTVGAVFKDIPTNSHLQTGMFLSIENILCHNMYSNDSPWKWGNFYTYFLTNKSVDKHSFNIKLADVANSNGAREYYGEDAEYHLFSLNEIHLNGESNYMDSNVSVSQIKIRIAIAIIIMAIAWLNLININLGSSIRNSVQVGVRRVLGASQRRLWSSVFYKLVVLNVISFVVSLLLYFTLFPIFEIFIGKQISLSIHDSLIFWVSILVFQLLGVLVVSISVHKLLNGQKVVNLLNKKSNSGKNKQSLWITLLITQFAASMVLICFAIISTKQVNALMQVDTGMQTEKIFAIHSANTSIGGDISTDRTVFEKEALRIPGVKESSSSSYVPGSAMPSFMPIRLNGKLKDDDISCRMNFIGYDYFSMFEHSLIAGRSFSEEYGADGEGTIINETLMKQLGFITPQEALGKILYWEHKDRYKTIIGVMEDFHQQSADVPVEPTMFMLWNHARGYTLLKVETNNASQTIADIENLWAEVHPGNVFSYFWVDEHYNSQFKKWINYSNEIKLFALIAILIACVGLFGLSSMLINNRVKEIGVRKVNGASNADILSMLNIGYVKWVLIAFLIATPLAYFIMNWWLQNFAYKTDISWWIFAISGLLSMCIAMLTVSW